MVAESVVVLFLLLSLGGGFVLYALVADERERRTTTDRASAEWAVRRDVGNERHGSDDR